MNNANMMTGVQMYCKARDISIRIDEFCAIWITYLYILLYLFVHGCLCPTTVCANLLFTIIECCPVKVYLLCTSYIHTDKTSHIFCCYISYYSTVPSWGNRRLSPDKVYMCSAGYTQVENSNLETTGHISRPNRCILKRREHDHHRQTKIILESVFDVHSVNI